MPAVQNGGGRQRLDDSVANRSHQLHLIASRQIGTTDGSGEKCIARKEVPPHLETATPRPVTGRMDDFHLQSSHFNKLSVGQGFIHAGRFHRIDAIECANFLQIFHQKTVVLMHPKRDVQSTLQVGRAHNVIEMTVRVKDALDLEIVLFRQGYNSLVLTTGIHDKSFARFKIAHEKNVFLEPAHSDHLDEQMLTSNVGERM